MALWKGKEAKRLDRQDEGLLLWGYTSARNLDAARSQIHLTHEIGESPPAGRSRQKAFWQQICLEYSGAP
jgi:hypothetical protein